MSLESIKIGETDDSTNIEAIRFNTYIKQLLSMKEILQNNLQQQLLHHYFIRQNLQANQPQKKEIIVKIQSIQESLENKQPQCPIILKKYYQNQTKNIPKNFGKAIINFMQRKRKFVQKLLGEQNIDCQELFEELKRKKKKFNTIADLRQLWTEKQFKYAKVMRTMSATFLRKASLNYIFNSRINNFDSHIKYRNRFLEVLKYPQQFTQIKLK